MLLVQDLLEVEFFFFKVKIGCMAFFTTSSILPFSTRSRLFCYAVFILSQVTQKCSSKRLNRNPDGLRNYFLTTTKNKRGMRGRIHNLSRRAGAVLTTACQEGLSFHLRSNLRHVQAVFLKQVAVFLKQVASEAKEQPRLETRRDAGHRLPHSTRKRAVSAQWPRRGTYRRHN